MDNRTKIKQAGEKYEIGSLEYQTLDMLLKIADTSETAAEIIAQDLETEEMSVEAAVLYLWEYSSRQPKRTCRYKGKRANGNVMTDYTAEKLLREFYKIPDESKEQPKKPSKQGKIVDLFDLL